MGNIFSKKGVKPDESNVEAIFEIEDTKNLMKYIQKLCYRILPMIKLVKKNTENVWMREQDKVFKNLWLAFCQF